MNKPRSESTYARLFEQKTGKIFYPSARMTRRFSALDRVIERQGLDPEQAVSTLIDKEREQYKEIDLFLPSAEDALRAALIEGSYKYQMLRMVEIWDDRQFTQEDWDWYDEWVEREFSWLYPKMTFQEAKEAFPDLYAECESGALDNLRFEMGVGPSPQNYEEIAYAIRNQQQ